MTQRNIKVVVRVRPFNCKEKENSVSSIIKVIDKTTLLFDPDDEDDEFFFQGVKQTYRDITKRVKKKLSMDFDRVFGTDNTNMDIFEECTAPLVDSVLNGYNCSVFVYGATGAGKTFTMLGNKYFPGLTILTMHHLFEEIAQHSQQQNRKFDVGVSYLEVYNEQVINLLTNRNPLKLREDANGVVVSGLKLQPIYNVEQLMEILTRGNANRTQHPTVANAESSRSHAVFQVHIRMIDQKTNVKRLVKLSMIDLAGSERAASTKGVGVRFKEGANINKSLLALGNCINKLADGSKHIPYRDSSLTRLLKDSLGGNCQTLMVANVSMSSLTYEDTYNTLKYASRAKKIRTILRQNSLKTNMPKEFYVKKFNELLEENEDLKRQLTLINEKEKTIKNDSSNDSTDENVIAHWYTRIKDAFSAIFKVQEQLCTAISAMDMKTFCFEFPGNGKLNGNRRQNSNYPISFSEALNNPTDKLQRNVTVYKQSYSNAWNALKLLEKEMKTTTPTIAKCNNIAQLFLKDNYDLLQKLRNSLIQANVNEMQALLINAQFNNQLKDEYQRNKCDKFYQYLKADTFRNNVMQELNSCCCDELIDNTTQDATLKLENNVKQQYYAGGHDSNDENREGEPRSKKPSQFNNLSNNNNNLNGTQIFSNSNSARNNDNRNGPNTLSDLNQIAPSTSSAASFTCPDHLVSNTTHLVESILQQQTLTASSKPENLRDVLVKSGKFRQNALKKALPRSAQKENTALRTNRIRKSPRTDILKIRKSPRNTATSSSNNIAKRQLLRETLANEYASAPNVRINRAATLRAKNNN